VIISFVAWSTQTGGRRSQEDGTGKLYGKPVPADQFRKEYFNTYLSMSLMFGQPLKRTEKLNDLLRKLTWRRMIVLQTAEKMGLGVSADEVAGTIAQQPSFIENGQFNPQRYQAFVQNFLARMGASEPQFEEQVREELLINKTKMLLGQTVWVAPLEIAQAFSQVYDTFVISYIFISADDLRHKIKVTEDEARKYLAAHPDDFKIPETMRVKYATFPFSRFVDKDGLKEDVLKSYYDENIEQFSVKTTNGWSNPIPFEDVEDEIREIVAQENAVNAAGDKALDFEVSLAPDRSGNAPSFEAAALAAGAAAQTSAFFSLKSAVAGLEVGPDFNEAAFNLRPTPDDYFSHPIKGSNAYYIIAFDQKNDARIPSFTEVKKEVLAAALEEAVNDKLNDTALYLHDTAAAAIKNGKPFAATLERLGVEVITTEPFSAKSGSPIDDEDIAYALIKNILMLNAGELSEIIALKNGSAIAYVDSRKPDDYAVFQAIRNDLGMFIKRRRAETAFFEWQEYLLKEAGFEDRLTQKRADQLPEDEPEPDKDTEL
jgi:peptidyl-prolyl cis-trans isomerase D